jgi:serine/threonine-protein kinase
VAPEDFDPFDRTDAVIGTEVGGYKIERELGRGGMGVVYAATHPMIGKRAAIKVLKPTLSDNPATVERFLQEARSVNQIGHPGIVDIFAFGSLPDGRRYLVMDLLEGESLRRRVKRGPLHVSEAVLVIDEIASALIAAHGKGFIHRDLKPDNVFLVALPGRTDVKLLDFGLAKLKPGAGQRAYRTATGAQLGTPDYMSPEQLRGSGDVDERSDTYSLGITAFEILTGERPHRFSDGTFDLEKPPAETLAALPMVAPELAQVVAQMMSANADDRPSLASIRTLMKRLRNALPSMSVVAMEVQRPAPDSGDHSLDSLTASAVGARPLLPTPALGAPTVSTAPPPPAAPPPAAPAPSDPRATVRRAPPPVGAGLARADAVHASTRIGVPPPPAAPPSPITQRQRAVAPEAARPPAESKLWLVIGVLLVVGAGVALLLVLAR